MTGDEESEAAVRSALASAQKQLDLAAELSSDLVAQGGAIPRNYRVIVRNIKHARKFVSLALDEIPVGDEADR